MSSNALDSLLSKPLPPANGALGKARRFREKTGPTSGVSGLRRHLNALAMADPEAIRTEVIARGRDPFIEGLISALEETGRWCSECERGGRERWAFRLYAELAKLVGSAPEIAVQIVNLVGAAPAVAKSSVETVARVAAMSPEERARLWAQSLARYCAEQGIAGLVIPEELTGSHAEVIETNGGLHG